MTKTTRPPPVRRHALTRADRRLAAALFAPRAQRLVYLRACHEANTRRAPAGDGA